MLHDLVFHNDRILPMTQVRLSPGQAGVINGWGVFSTLRIYEGWPFAFERHWDRLMTDARRLQIPTQYPMAEVRAQLLALMAVNGVSSGCARIYLIYNKIGIWHSEEPMRDVDLLMYTSDLPSRTGTARLALTPNSRHAAHPLAGVKVISWLSNAWVFEQAHQRGFDDALLLNEHGHVSECTAANIYWVSGGTVFTPPLSAGCLPGVTRQVLLDVAAQAGYPVVQEAAEFEAVKNADEVFITSTTRQVQGVSRIQESEFSNAPGPVTTRLAKLFSDYVADEVARSRAGLAARG
ncbi:MAG: aminotransferase class IV [Candidatus Korobacteraceae bacterium]